MMAPESERAKPPKFWNWMYMEQVCPFTAGEKHAIEVRRYLNKSHKFAIRVSGHRGADGERTATQFDFARRRDVLQVAWWLAKVALFHHQESAR